MTRRIFIDDPDAHAIVRSLARAALLSHSGRSFLEHLVGTWRILATWRMPQSLCRAGLLHSAYSTSFYPHALFGLDQRERVRKMIGRRAEDLAFRFCTMDRRDFWDRLVEGSHRPAFSYPDRIRAGAVVRVARRTLCELLILESANVAEQSSAADMGPAPWMSRVLGWWKFLDRDPLPLRRDARLELTARADRSAIEAYLAAQGQPASRASALLFRASRRNPWIGEPRVLRALYLLDTDRARADALAKEGAELLSAWAAPWDKRLPLANWLALADRIRAAATKSVSAAPDLQWVCAPLFEGSPTSARRWVPGAGKKRRWGS